MNIVCNAFTELLFVLPKCQNNMVADLALDFDLVVISIENA